MSYFVLIFLPDLFLFPDAIEEIAPLNDAKCIMEAHGLLVTMAIPVRSLKLSNVVLALALVSTWMDDGCSIHVAGHV